MPTETGSGGGTIRVRHRTALMALVLVVAFTLLPVLLGLFVAPWFFLIMIALIVVPFLIMIDAPTD
jgi:hypothetical protein